MMTLGNRDIVLPPAVTTELGIPYWEPIIIREEWEIEPQTGILLTRRALITHGTRYDVIDLRTENVHPWLYHVADKAQLELMRGMR